MKWKFDYSVYDIEFHDDFRKVKKKIREDSIWRKIGAWR